MVKLRSTSMILSNHELRRAAPILIAVIVLSACSDLGGGDAASLVALAKNAWDGNDQTVTLEQAAAVPYASMGIRVGNSPEAMIILAGDTDGRRLWTSSAGVAISTTDGRIVRTAGFVQNLGGYDLREDTLGKDGARTIRWQADFPDINLYSVQITCHDRLAGDETITILGKDIHTRRIDESCVSRSESLDWSFSNTYWLDASSGLVWRSIQHVHPRDGAVETEILRPPG